MATAQMDTVIRHLRRVLLRQDGADWTDGQLLASFIDQKDEAAFEALVRRHGPMVFGVCRRVVGNHHDAEDAFQATILVLARKAASVRPRERVANWLHGVALRTAMKAKAVTAKRQGREQQVTEMPEPEAVEPDQQRDLQPVLDQELNGLPENFRLPILLCDLEGKTIKEAAHRLGWPQGTLAGRLARGRKLLAKRLASRGAMLSAGSLAAFLSHNVASAGAPTSLMSSTVKAATMIAAGQATFAGAVPAKVVVLTKGVMKSMMLTKLSKAVAGLVVMGVMGVMVLGGGQLTHRTAAGQQTKSEQDGDKPAIGQSAPVQTPKTDLDRLQGVWSVVSEEQGGGQPSTLDNVVFFMVDGKRACWQTSDSEMQGGLYLEPTSKPKTYDFVTSASTIEGIYSLDGDTLRLCWDKGTETKRPGGFITEKGSQQVFFVLKRIHGPEVFPYRLADGTRAFPPIIKKAKTIPPPQLAPTPKDSRPAPYNEKPDQKPKLGSAPAESDKPTEKDMHTNVKEEPTGKPVFGTSPKLNGEGQQDFPVKVEEGNRFVVPFAPGLDFPVQVTNAEDKKLQGAWRKVMGMYGKYPHVPGVSSGENIKNTNIIIEGNEWIGWTPEGKKQKVAFRVDVSETLDIKDDGFASGLEVFGLRAEAVKAPKRLDIKEVGGDYVHGIYGLSGDDLVIRLLPSGKQGRPTQFAMTIEDGVLLLYKRSEPGDAKAKGSGEKP